MDCFQCYCNGDVFDNNDVINDVTCFLDADEGANARIMYSLSGPESTAFLISSSDGKITTRSSLDFEKKRSYQFRVIASDGGQNVQRGTSRVTVNVVDVNDNEPVFGGPYTVHVSEDVARGKNVITVKATDKDSGLLTFSFLRVVHSFVLCINGQLISQSESQ